MEKSKKLSKAREAEIRASLYKKALNGFSDMHIEPITKGSLIEFEENGQLYYATLNITLHNPEKFDVQEVRQNYITRLEAAAQRSAEKAERDRKKVEKLNKK